MTDKYLFLFSLGPVQTFIEQARKTHDLYAGSSILAALTRVAAETAQQQGVNLIFPFNISPDSPIPNRFVGKINHTSDTALQAVGDAVEASVQDTFNKLAEEALKAARVNADNRFWTQIGAQWDINWLFYPLEGDGNAAYREAYRYMEQEMVSLKNMRLISQSMQIDRKCSLDGERTALFFGEGSNPNYTRQGQIINQGGLWLAQNEGLSAISFTKRGYGKGSGVAAFPSTAEIALLHEIDKNKGLFTLYKDCLRIEEFDYQLCYKENLTEKYLRKNGYGKALETVSVSALETCRVNLFSGRDLPKHYALVAFDGDNMGQLLSGASHIFKGDDLEDFQRAVSARLIAFANAVQQKFREHEQWGRVVYTGGDDFLGFLNLSSMFEAVAWLREAFQQIVNKPLREDGYFEPGFNFTFSAGIAMAHYKMPLSIVIARARAMETDAKNSGRDAFAIAALKHSGESHESCFKWDLAGGLTHWNALGKLTMLLEEKVCSENFARVLARSFYQLQDDKGRVPNSEMIKTELRRLIKRAMSPQHVEKADWVADCVEQLLLPSEAKSGDLAPLDNFVEALNIALFLKRVRKSGK